MESKASHCQAQCWETCCHASGRTCARPSFDWRQAAPRRRRRSWDEQHSLDIDAAAASSRRSSSHSASNGELRHADVNVSILKSMEESPSLSGTDRIVRRGTAGDSSESRQCHSRLVVSLSSLSALLDCRRLLLLLLPLHLVQDSRRRSEVCGGSCLTMSLKMMFVTVLTLCAANTGHGTSLLCVNITACTNCSQNVRLPSSGSVITLFDDALEERKRETISRHYA